SDGGSSHGQQAGGRTPPRSGQGRLRATRGGSLPDGGRHRSDGWHPPAVPPRPVKSALERVGRLPYVAVLASLLGVGALAVAQPMLDLLGRNPEFFIARRFPVPDIVLLALALVVGPLVLFVPVWLGRRAGPAVGAVTHLLAL